MKRRIIKKRNKKYIQNILNQLKGVHKARFMCPRLVIFSFANQPANDCIFRLKQFPKWLFGIFLDGEGGYDIFGEIEILIDKFRPYHTTTCEKNIVLFQKRLDRIIVNNGFINEEHRTIYQEEVIEIKSKQKFQFNMWKKMTAKIQEIEAKNKSIKIQIQNVNSKGFQSYPKYELIPMEDAENEQSNEAWQQIYDELKALLPPHGSWQRLWNEFGLWDI